MFRNDNAFVLYAYCPSCEDVCVISMLGRGTAGK